MDEHTTKKDIVQHGPEQKTTRVPALDDIKLNQIVQEMVESLEEDKAEDVVVIDLVGKASFADRMIIATGLADRQIMAMAEHLDKLLFTHGIKKISIERSADWVLLDTGDIIVHLFRAEAREYYNIERIWGVDLPEKHEDSAS